LSDILGKNDEDMRWHPDPEPFKRDEERVLREGAVISGAFGTCVIRGRVRRIMASKAPIYDKGRITGLVGYFIDVTDASRLSAVYDSDRNTDPQTGLLNGSGAFLAARQAQKAYEEEGADFGMLTVWVLNLSEFRRSFGRERHLKLLNLIARATERALPEGAAIARVSAGRFAAVVKAENAACLRDYKYRILNALSAIKEADSDTPVTLYALCGTALYSQYGDLAAMSEASAKDTGRTLDITGTAEDAVRIIQKAYEEKAEEAERYLLENQQLEQELRELRQKPGLDAREKPGFSISDLAKDIPIGIFACKAHGDEQLLYMNHRCTALFGFDDVDACIRHVKGSFRHMMLAEDAERAEAEIWEQSGKKRRKELCEISYRIRRKDGAVRQMLDIRGLVRHRIYGELFFCCLIDTGCFEDEE